MSVLAIIQKFVGIAFEVSANCHLVSSQPHDDMAVILAADLYIYILKTSFDFRKFLKK